MFEDGPSTDITLQWARYYDAADECSLSRIYGGIHPPADDIPGRLMGAVIGVEAFELALSYFNGLVNPRAPLSFPGSNPLQKSACGVGDTDLEFIIKRPLPRPGLSLVSACK